MSRGFLLATIALLSCMSPSIVAQCGPTSFAVTNYGSGCGPGIVPAFLATQYSASGCIVTFTTTVPTFGFNVFVQNHFLAIGLQPDVQPIAGFPGCDLLLQPLLIIAQPPGANVFSFQVPPWVISHTFLLQAANVWFDTFSFATILQVTQGLAVTFF